MAEEGENDLENMLNLAQKQHPVVKVLVFPIIFETTARALRQEHFFDPHVIVFVKNDWITISVPIILSINQWSLSFKSVVWTMIYISKLSAFLIFQQIFIRI